MSTGGFEGNNVSSIPCRWKLYTLSLSYSQKWDSESFLNTGLCILDCLCERTVHYLAQMRICVFNQMSPTPHTDWMRITLYVKYIRKNSHWTLAIKVRWGCYLCHLMCFPPKWMKKKDWWYLALENSTSSSVDIKAVQITAFLVHWMSWNAKEEKNQLI